MRAGAVIALVFAASLASAQTSISQLTARTTFGKGDTYSVALKAFKSFTPSPKSFVGSLLPKLSFEADSFAGTGMVYKENVAGLLGRANYAVTPRLIVFIGLLKPADINHLTLADFSLDRVQTTIGFSYSL